MVDLEKLQTRVTEDDEARKAFITDPVGFLRAEGLNLTPEMEASLQKSVAEAVESRGDPSEGALPRGGPAIHISVNIPF